MSEQLTKREQIALAIICAQVSRTDVGNLLGGMSGPKDPKTYEAAFACADYFLKKSQGHKFLAAEETNQ